MKLNLPDPEMLRMFPSVSQRAFFSSLEPHNPHEAIVLQMETLRSGAGGHVTCPRSLCCHRVETRLRPGGPSSQAAGRAYFEEETEAQRGE